METNYIVHLNNSFKRFTDDQKATPFHISLYMALFHKWNSAKFRNPLSIARDDLMFLSKIGSANTYIKCLKELHAWGYIKYVPSHSYHIGSKIYMYTFNKTTQTTTDNANSISSNKTNGETSTQELRLYKNNSKTTKQNNTTKEKEEHKPSLEELISYFKAKGVDNKEAEKFFNYFESNGWLIGGKTPMKNWKAAANNWILNCKKFESNNKNNTHPAGKLHTSTNKNYNEPL